MKQLRPTPDEQNEHSPQKRIADGAAKGIEQTVDEYLPTVVNILADITHGGYIRGHRTGMERHQHPKHKGRQQGPLRILYQRLQLCHSECKVTKK